MHITIIYSKPSEQYASSQFIAADEDTTLAAQEIAQTLQKNGHNTAMIDVDIHNVVEKLSQLASLKTDCIFNLIDWGGSDLPYALYAVMCIEQSGIPFTGATTENYLLVSNKVLMKREFDRYAISTPQWQSFISGDEALDARVVFPSLIKPALQHCSIGLSRDMVVKDETTLRTQVKKQLQKFGAPVYAEEFIEGREFHVAVIEQDGKPTVLPPVEISFFTKGTDAFLTYEGRWVPEHGDYQTTDIDVPNNLDPQLLQNIQNVSKSIFTNLNYRDYMRVDMRVQGNEVFVLEANCNPGLGDDDESAIPLAYRAIGHDFAWFLEQIITSAMRRWGKNAA